MREFDQRFLACVACQIQMPGEVCIARDNVLNSFPWARHLLGRLKVKGWFCSSFCLAFCNCHLSWFQGRSQKKNLMKAKIKLKFFIWPFSNFFLSKKQQKDEAQISFMNSTETLSAPWLQNLQLFIHETRPTAELASQDTGRFVHHFGFDLLRNNG